MRVRVNHLGIRILIAVAIILIIRGCGIQQHFGLK